jgi:hypothetical protein
MDGPNEELEPFPPLVSTPPGPPPPTVTVYDVETIVGVVPVR